LFGGIRVQNQLISAFCLLFLSAEILVFSHRLFWQNPLFEALNVSWLFTFCQLIVYFFVSWLFTFLSAVCLGALGFEISWFQLFIYIFALKFLFFLDFFLQKCQQLFVYFFVSWLFIFVSWLFTIWIFAPKASFFRDIFVSIPSLTLFCLLLSAVCLFFCQLIVYNLNFRAKNLVFPWLFCQYRCFNTLILLVKIFQFLRILDIFSNSQIEFCQYLARLSNFSSFFQIFGHFSNFQIEFCQDLARLSNFQIVQHFFRFLDIFPTFKLSFVNI